MITQSSGRWRLYPAVLAVALVSAGAHSAGAGDNPFPALVGSWSGAGEARFDNGQSESMRCKGYYTADGAQGIGPAIRCANAAAKIDLRAKLTYSNGSVSGDWEERTYNASGTVAGKASAEKVMVTITGGGLTGSMAVANGGSGHSVTINTKGTGLKGVVISLTRG
jgi:hypothetical protein